MAERAGARLYCALKEETLMAIIVCAGRELGVLWAVGGAVGGRRSTVSQALSSAPAQQSEGSRQRRRGSGNAESSIACGYGAARSVGIDGRGGVRGRWWWWIGRRPFGGAAGRAERERERKSNRGRGWRAWALAT